MYIVIVSLIILVAVLLTLVVLVQESKGGGLASNFSGSNQVMGVQKTTDIVEKATWVLAVVLIVLCLSTSMISGSDAEIEDNTSKTEEFVN